ncbi:MAG: SufD family Fe-S cluster assembly protein, partial [Chloroflexota bacterium]|nr:SufD family Fe-S cluster assembly protein [Chloroflexota bacterium]
MTAIAATQESAYLDASRRVAAAEPLPSFAARLRERGAERFGALGFPTARRGNEYWKYTDVAPIARGAFTLPEHPSPAPPPQCVVDGATVATIAGGFVVSTPGDIGGAYAGSLRDAPEAALAAAGRALGAVADLEDEAFAALNAALMQDVFVLYAPAGAQLPAPVHLTITTAQGAASQPRVLIVCERGAEASVVISHTGQDGAPYFANAITEVLLGADARLRLFHARNHRANALHVETTAARLERGASLRSFALDVGVGLVRHNLNVALAEPGASADAVGVSVAGGAAHLDNHLFLHHESAETNSSALYKGVG